MSAPVVAWRIAENRFARKPFDGEGARLFGGRWNSAGVPAVYLSSSRSLAVLERLVHAKDKATLLECCLFAVTIPPELIEEVIPSKLKSGWNRLGRLDITQSIGDDWFTRASKPVLRVPSVVVEGEDNFVLNPAHPQFNQLAFGKKRKLPIDPRLLE